MTKTRIALIQMKMSSEQNNNMDTAIRKIKDAVRKKAKVICLPELFLSNYFCQQEKHSNFNLAEKIPGETTNILSELAKELKVIIIIPLYLSTECCKIYQDAIDKWAGATCELTF